MPCFALKYLTRYTHETFFMEYINYKIFRNLSHCGVIPVQSFGRHIRPQPHGLGLNGWCSPFCIKGHNHCTRFTGIMQHLGYMYQGWTRSSSLVLDLSLSCPKDTNTSQSRAVGDLTVRGTVLRIDNAMPVPTMMRILWWNLKLGTRKGNDWGHLRKCGELTITHVGW